MTSESVRRMPKSYTGDFKRDAVTRIAAGNETIKEISKDLGVHSTTLYLWRKTIKPWTTIDAYKRIVSEAKSETKTNGIDKSHPVVEAVETQADPVLPQPKGMTFFRESDILRKENDRLRQQVVNLKKMVILLTDSIS